MSRTLVSSGSPYEKSMGFSRAVRQGNTIAISGTAAIGEDGKTVGINDAAVQAQHCFEIIKNTLEEAGASLKDVIRTRTFLTNINDWEKVAEIRGQFFKDINPVETVMEVNRFINPEWLIEIEVDAIIDDE